MAISILVLDRTHNSAFIRGMSEKKHSKFFVMLLCRSRVSYHDGKKSIEFICIRQRARLYGVCRTAIYLVLFQWQITSFAYMKMYLVIWSSSLEIVPNDWLRKTRIQWRFPFFHFPTEYDWMAHEKCTCLNFHIFVTCSFIYATFPLSSPQHSSCGNNIKNKIKRLCAHIFRQRTSKRCLPQDWMNKLKNIQPPYHAIEFAAHTALEQYAPINDGYFH